MTLEQGKIYNICGASGTGKSYLTALLLDLYFPSHTIITNDKDIFATLANTRQDHELVQEFSKLKNPLNYYTSAKHVFVCNFSFGGEFPPITQTQIIMSIDPRPTLENFPVAGIIYTSWKKNKEIALKRYQDSASGLGTSNDFDLMFNIKYPFGYIADIQILKNRSDYLNGAVSDHMKLVDRGRSTLAEQSKLLDAESKKLAERSEILAKQAKILNDRSKVETTVLTSPFVKNNQKHENQPQSSGLLQDIVNWKRHETYSILGAAGSGKTWLATYYLKKFFPEDVIMTNDEDLYETFITSGSKNCYYYSNYKYIEKCNNGVVFVVNVKKGRIPDEWLSNVKTNTSVIILSEEYCPYMSDSQIIIASKDTNKDLVTLCCPTFCQNITNDCDLVLTPNGSQWNVSCLNVRNSYLNRQKNQASSNMSNNKNVENSSDDKTKTDVKLNVSNESKKINTDDVKTTTENNDAKLGVNTANIILIVDANKFFDVLCWSIRPRIWYRTDAKSDNKIILTDPESEITGTLMKVIPNAFGIGSMGFLMSRPIENHNEFQTMPVAPERVSIVTSPDFEELYFQWKDSVLVFDYEKTRYLDGVPCGYEIIVVGQQKLFDKQYQIVKYYTRKNSNGNLVTFVLIKV